MEHAVTDKNMCALLSTILLNAPQLYLAILCLTSLIYYLSAHTSLEVAWNKNNNHLQIKKTRNFTKPIASKFWKMWMSLYPDRNTQKSSNPFIPRVRVRADYPWTPHTHWSTYTVVDRNYSGSRWVSTAAESVSYIYLPDQRVKKPGKPDIEINL